MKLIHYIIRNLSIALFFIMTIWGTIFYFYMIDEVNDETNDSLENYAKIIIKRSLTDSTTLRSQSDVMSKYIITKIDEKTFQSYHQDQFSDSTIFIENELEYEPVRVLKTTFISADRNYNLLTVMTSTLEKDDLTEKIMLSVIVLYIILLICILIISREIIQKSLKSLYSLIQWINEYVPGKKNEPFVNHSKVSEFKTISDTVMKLTKKNETYFAQQKQFIENASHELQTPLAICRNKLELLSEESLCNESQLIKIGEIDETLRQIVNLNKSLLLLSRIDNNQYRDDKEIIINDIIKQLTSDISDVYEYKEISIEIEEKEILSFHMDEILVKTLISNLFRNAIIHNYRQGNIRIKIEENQVIFSNSGSDVPLNKELIFERFYQSDKKKKGSNGLGLAIVKSICALYHIDIDYQYLDHVHSFILTFNKCAKTN